MEKDSRKYPVKRYVNLEPIGRGGMGELYRAFDQKTGQTVAIKIIRPDKENQEATTRRFHREASALQELSHPNIVTLYDFYEQQNVLYFTMEYIEGRTLRQVVAEERLPISRTLSWITHLADALATAHEKGIIHRDIKPSNIMISHDNKPLLLDFGLAKQREITDLETVTKTGQIVGTLVFLPPEVVTGGEHDEQADVYQLAFTLYVALTGQYPLTLATLASHVSGLYKIKPPSTYRKDIAKDLDELTLSSLSAKKETRPQSARLFKEKLEQCRHRRATKRQSPFRRSSRRRFPKLTAMGRSIALLAAFTFVISFFWLGPFGHFAPPKEKLRAKGPRPSRPPIAKSRTFKPSPQIFTKVTPPPTPKDPRRTPPTAKPPKPSASPKPKPPEKGQDHFALAQKAFHQGDYKLAFTLYEKAASQGHVEAAFSLGACFENGLGPPVSPEQAATHYLKAAEAGHVAAQARVANFYQQGTGLLKSPQAAANWLRTAAANGHLESQYALAKNYLAGKGLLQDERQAFHWLQQAARQNHVAAMFELGRCYDEGRGTTVDALLGHQWMSKAADLGFPPAMRKLGRSFRTPPAQPTAKPHPAFKSPLTTHIRNIVAPPPAEEVDETEAALQRARQAMQRLDHRRVLSNLKIAVRHMNPEALHAMGQCYETGLGTGQDHRQARQWYKKAATRGHAPAQLALAEIYLDGKGVRPDLVTAERWLYKAVNQGHVPAMLRLAAILEHGKGVFYQDRLKALDLYKKAAAKGSARAATEVGRCYQRGIGASSDRHEAKRWFEKARSLSQQ